MRIAFLIFLLGFAIPVVAQSRPATSQHAGDCSINISGSDNKASLVCNDLDRTIADQMRALLNASRQGDKTAREISQKLDVLLKEIEQQTGSFTTGPITQGPGSIAQFGGEGNQATVNNFGPPEPKISFFVLDSPPRYISPAFTTAHNQVWIAISIDRTMTDPKFAVQCDRPCHAVNAHMVQPRGGFQKLGWGKAANNQNIAVLFADAPNPMPSDNKYFACIESEDDNDAPQILAVGPFVEVQQPQQ